MTPEAAYQEIVVRSREVAILNSCSALLGWDEQTYMPRAGAGHRGEQMALLAGLAHERATDPRLGDLLASVESSARYADADLLEAANLREWRWRYDRAVKLPRALVEQVARVETETQGIWVVARKQQDFRRLEPHLAALIDLKKEQAACLAGEGPPYDALLSEYEPGATEAELTPLLVDLGHKLKILVDRIAGATRRVDRSILERSYPVDRQKWFAEMVAGSIGFDFEAGRLDLTSHPFCSGIGPGDCRLTTRYRENDFGDGLFGVLHEAGHGMYEQGLDPAHFGTPMGDACSLGVHESQSRFWENTIGRSQGFWEYWFPLARGTFQSALSGVRVAEFHEAINQVDRTLIRVEADEVTYNLHVLIRYRLERDLITGLLPVSDLPEAWNAAYEEVLGIEPGNDAEGCLQDIHWSAGLFGYFPTYTIGNLLAAQLADAMERDLGPLDELSRAGDSAPILQWLRAKVHRHGQRFRLAELAKIATGGQLDSAPMLDRLTSKYGDIYGL